MPDSVLHPRCLNVWPNSVTNFRLDASTNHAGFVFVAPKTGTIDRIQLYITAVSASPTYRVRLEGAFGAYPMRPNNIAYANAHADFTPGAVGVVTLGLVSPLAVTEGTAYGIRVKHQTGTIGASNYMEMTLSAGTINNTLVGGAYALQSTTSGLVWTANFGQIPSITVLYDDDHAVPSMGAIETAGERPWGTTTPKLGSTWSAGIGSACTGALIQVRATSNTNVTGTLSLYEGDAGAPASPAVRTRTVAQGQMLGEVSTGIHDYGVVRIEWPAYALVPNTRYWLELDLSSTNIITGFCDFANAESRNAVVGDIAAYTIRTTFPPLQTDYPFRFMGIQPVLEQSVSRQALVF